MPQTNKEKPNDVNMWPVGIGNTRISTNHVQKPLQTPPTMIEMKSNEIDFKIQEAKTSNRTKKYIKTVSNKLIL